jgi:hypothetical protein
VERTRPGLAFGLVGMFGLLVVGAIALSLSSAPPVAQQQLHVAAGATLAATGFALIDTNSISPLSPAARAADQGQNARTVVIRVLYTAPDRVQESEVGPNGQTVSVIVIGARRYRSSGSGWTELPPSPGLGAQAAETITSPLRAAANATTVTRQGDVYYFVPPDVVRFLSSVLGVNASQLSSPSLSAVIHGDFLTDERISAVVQHQRLSVDLAFFAIGSAPPVLAPPPSSLVPAPEPSPTPTP